MPDSPYSDISAQLEAPDNIDSLPSSAIICDYAFTATSDGAPWPAVSAAAPYGSAPIEVALIPDPDGSYYQQLLNIANENGGAVQVNPPLGMESFTTPGFAACIQDGCTGVAGEEVAVSEGSYDLLVKDESGNPWFNHDYLARVAAEVLPAIP